ncbi:hypothetical protein [Pseudoduganella sp.]|uniref:hypothetical protein n=1 Tax=Pseudoduganella sp. TaxID=1880898 RepID=UPI0035AD88A2
MHSDNNRKPNGDLECRVVRIESSSTHQAETLKDFKDETRRNFDRVHAGVRILTGMLFTVVLGVFALLAKVYGA